MKTNKITGIFVILFLILLIGVIGYHWIEGWSFFDSLYMTVITLATVGYGETHPLSQTGRLFTIFLILGGMGILLYAITEITAFLVEGEMHGFLRRRKMEKNIQRLSDHYIICGGGRSGQYILDELLKTKRDCVVIEKDPVKARILSEKSIPVIEGDATEDSILISAGIDRAQGLASALPTDKDNLFTVITARGLNPKLRIVSKNGRNRFV